MHIVIPLLDKLTFANADNYQGTIYGSLLHFFKVPYYQFLFLSVCLLLSNLGFFLGLFYYQEIVCIVFRAIYGVVDALHRCKFSLSKILDYALLFITKQFYGSSFSLGVLILASSDIFVQPFSQYLKRISGIGVVDTIVLSNVFFGISLAAVIALPYMDYSTRSIFKVFYKTFPKKTEKGYWNRILSSFAAPVHIILWFCVVITLRYLEGLFENQKYSTDVIANSRAAFNIIQSIALPALGAILDTEHTRLNKPLSENTFIRIIYSSFYKYKLHYFMWFFGILGAFITTICIYIIPLPLANLMFLVAFHSFFLSCITAVLFSAPMLVMRNLNYRYRVLLYPSYMNFVYFFIACANLLIYFFNGNPAVYDAYNIIIIILLSILIGTSLLIFLFYTLFSISVYLYDQTKVYREILFEKLQKKEDDYRIQSSPWNYLRLIYLIPIELIVFVLSLLLLFTVCGGLNILLHVMYSTTANSNIPNVLFLPILFGLTIIAGFFTFPNEIRSLISVCLFSKSREIIFGLNEFTLGQIISTDYNFTLAHEAIKKKAAVYKNLFKKKLNPPLAVYVVPDKIILPNEEERIIVEDLKVINPTDLMMDSEYVDFSNGRLCINNKIIGKNLFTYKDEDIDKVFRSKFKGRFINFKTFYNKFTMWSFIAYFLFFLIPIFYKLILKITCRANTCNAVVIFEDNIQTVIIAVNFIFGIVLMIPFVEIYHEISKVLEDTLNYTIHYKNYSIAKFTFKTKDEYEKLSQSELKQYDLEMTHLQNMINARGEFLKYSFLFVMFIARIVSTTFALFALFVKGTVSIDIINIIYLVMAIEIFVSRFILLPATIITGEHKGVWGGSLAREKAYNKFIYSTDVNPKCEKVSRFWRSMNIPYDVYQCTGDFGFNVRSASISTKMYINPGMMRNWIWSFLFSVIPSIITYFVKQAL